ncbi:MAG: hypothetical protein ABIF06_00505 [bacterium]
MNPEEKELLERVAALSKENNRILLKIQKAAHWAKIWGFIKFVIIVTPIVLGILYLQPYMDTFIRSYQEIKNVLPILDSVPN